MSEQASTVLSLPFSFLLLSIPPPPTPRCLEGAGRALWLRGMKEPTSVPYQTHVRASRPRFPLLSSLGVSSGEVESPADPVWKIWLCEAGRKERSPSLRDVRPGPGSHFWAPLRWPCSVFPPDRPSPSSAGPLWLLRLYTFFGNCPPASAPEDQEEVGYTKEGQAGSPILGT